MHEDEVSMQDVVHELSWLDRRISKLTGLVVLQAICLIAASITWLAAEIKEQREGPADKQEVVQKAPKRSISKAASIWFFYIPTR
jgi:hypothetical protein